MTLRDYFAGQALIGLAMGMNAAARQKYLHDRAEGREATIAYQLADAMLREREATPDPSGDDLREMIRLGSL